MAQVPGTVTSVSADRPLPHCEAGLGVCGSDPRCGDANRGKRSTLHPADPCHLVEQMQGLWKAIEGPRWPLGGSGSRWGARAPDTTVPISSSTEGNRGGGVSSTCAIREPQTACDPCGDTGGTTRNTGL